MRRAIFAAIAALTLAPVSSPAETIKRDVAEMLESCRLLREDPETFRGGVCAGQLAASAYIMGQLCIEERSGHEVRFFTADTSGTSLLDLTQALSRWADANPDRWIENETWGIVLALKDAYPCK